MIRGYFSTDTRRRRPFVDGVFQFSRSHEGFETPLLVDTGADRTILAPVDAIRLELELGVDYTSLEPGPPSTGVGGRVLTRTVGTVLRLGELELSLQLTILEPRPIGELSPIPSLLGRDIISQFGLFIEERTDRVILLEPHETGDLLLY